MLMFRFSRSRLVENVLCLLLTPTHPHTNNTLHQTQNRSAGTHSSLQKQIAFVHVNHEEQHQVTGNVLVLQEAPF